MKRWQEGGDEGVGDKARGGDGSCRGSDDVARKVGVGAMMRSAGRARGPARGPAQTHSVEERDATRRRVTRRQESGRSGRKAAREDRREDLRGGRSEWRGMVQIVGRWGGSRGGRSSR